MADKTINTRLVLRNANLSSWLSSTVELLKGEVALAQKTDGNFEIRVGTSGKTWNQLSDTGHLIIPSKDVENLTYDEYRLSSIDVAGTELQSKFQLQGKSSATGLWVDIGNAIEIPEVDFGPVNAKIEYLSSEISTINETTIPAVKQELSNYTDEQVSATKTELKGDASTALSTDITIEGARKYADTKAQYAKDDAITTSKEYTDQVSSFLSGDYEGKYQDLLAKIKDGIHFVGKVVALSIDTSVAPNKGYYEKVAGTKIYANNGDLAILSGVEYVYSENDIEWILLGDEGSWATKSYVDTAKQEAIDATKNTIKHFTSKDDLDLSVNYGTNTGDIAIVKELIADSTVTTDEQDKYEYTAYVWDNAIAGDNKWKAMDGNYNAENVYFKENIVKAGSWTSVGNVTHSANTVQSLAAKGKNVMEVMEMIMKGDELYPTQASSNKPTVSITWNGGQYEYGTTVTPKFTISLDPRTYTYGSNSNTTNGSKTGISATNWTIDYTKYDGTAGTQLTGVWNTQCKTASASKEVSIDSIVLTSTYTAKNLTAYGEWVAAPENTYIPRSNLERVLSSASESTKYRTADGNASTNSRGGSDFTVKYPRFWKFTTSVEDVPTTFSASSYSGWNREYSNKTSFTATVNWFQLFYIEPADQGHTSWTGKDSNNITLKVAPSQSVQMTYINGDTGSYRVFIVTNAAAYSPTTCTMTMA